jgi:hypothetical protein
MHATGRSGLSVIVSDRNHGARRLYERHGYRSRAQRLMVKEEWENPRYKLGLAHKIVDRVTRHQKVISLVLACLSTFRRFHLGFSSVAFS